MADPWAKVLDRAHLLLVPYGRLNEDAHSFEGQDSTLEEFFELLRTKTEGLWFAFNNMELTKNDTGNVIGVQRKELQQGTWLERTSGIYSAAGGKLRAITGSLDPTNQRAKILLRYVDDKTQSDKVGNQIYIEVVPVDPPNPGLTIKTYASKNSIYPFTNELLPTVNYEFTYMSFDSRQVTPSEKGSITQCHGLRPGFSLSELHASSCWNVHSYDDGKEFSTSDGPHYLVPALTEVLAKATQLYSSTAPNQIVLEKKSFPPGANIRLVGDIQSNMRPLLDFLKHLVDEQAMTDDGELLRNEHLVFLGNFVSRGTFGVEVLYMILQLKVKNPDRVVLVRGNHDTDVQSELASSGHDAMEFICRLPCAIFAVFGGRRFVFCHGGVPPVHSTEFPKSDYFVTQSDGLFSVEGKRDDNMWMWCDFHFRRGVEASYISTHDGRYKMSKAETEIFTRTFGVSCIIRGRENAKDGVQLLPDFGYDEETIKAGTSNIPYPSHKVLVITTSIAHPNKVNLDDGKLKLMYVLLGPNPRQQGLVMLPDYM